MGLSGPSACIAFAVACLYTLLFTPPLTRRVTPRARQALLLGMAVAGLVAHVNVLRWSSSGGLGLQTPPPHVHELFHYFLGSRYFAELGYTGLYEATVVADSEDSPAGFQSEALIRNLENGRLELSRGAVAARGSEIRAQFTAERWTSFKHDVAVFRNWMQPGYWHTTGFVVDHGYNAPPLVTAILGALSNGGLVSAGDFAGLLRFLDLYLIGLLGIFLIGLDAPAAGLSFLVFAFANPLHDYSFVGGAFLRSDYLIPLVLAALALRMQWLRSCGVLLAVSGWMRLFPLLLIAVVALHDLLQRQGWTRLRSHARLYAAFAATSLCLLAATSWLPTPRGGNPWLAFFHNTRGHAASEAANRIGAAALVSFSPQGLTAVAAESPSQRLARWDVAARQLRQRRHGLALAGSTILAILAIAAARRTPLGLLALPWMLLVFALQPLSHYYWAMLAVVPVAAGPDERLHRLAGATLALLALTASPLLPASAAETRFALYSGEVLVFLLVACFLAARTDTRRRPGCAS